MSNQIESNHRPPEQNDPIGNPTDVRELNNSLKNVEEAESREIESISRMHPELDPGDAAEVTHLIAEQEEADLNKAQAALENFVAGTVPQYDKLEEQITQNNERVPEDVGAQPFDEHNQVGILAAATMGINAPEKKEKNQVSTAQNLAENDGVLPS